MPAPKGNRNAQRADERATSLIVVRVTPAEKARVVKAARGRKLSEFVRERLGLGK